MAADYFFAELKTDGEGWTNEMFSSAKQLELLPYLLNSLSSSKGELRLQALNVLNHFESLKKVGSNQICNVFSIMRDIETTPYVATEVRGFTYKMKMVQSMLDSGVIPSSYIPSIIHYFIGTFYIRYHLL